jgi:hypothetical protein
MCVYRDGRWLERRTRAFECLMDVGRLVIFFAILGRRTENFENWWSGELVVLLYVRCSAWKGAPHAAPAGVSSGVFDMFFLL